MEDLRKKIIEKNLQAIINEKENKEKINKELEQKATIIKGKKYVEVVHRVKAFHELYPNGAITTQLVSDPASDRIVIKATVIPDVDNPNRFFSDYASETVGDGMINMKSAMENASTSAIGRALASLGIGVIDSFASVDEMKKAGAYTPELEKKEVKEFLKGMDYDTEAPYGRCEKCGSPLVMGNYGKPYCRKCYLEKKANK